MKPACKAREKALFHRRFLNAGAARGGVTTVLEMPNTKPETVDAERYRLRYTSPAPEALPALGADVVVLALPNGKAGACVAAA